VRVHDPLEDGAPRGVGERAHDGVEGGGLHVGIYISPC
jgi:hypothetical protein